MNIVKNISEQRKFDKIRCDSVEQTRSNLNESVTRQEYASKDTQQKTFVSRIPRLGQSIGRNQKAEPRERYHQVSEMRQSISPQKRAEQIPSTSPQKRDLAEMN